jgi:hypothetical protein
MASKFLIPTILTTLAGVGALTGVGLDIMGNTLSQAYPDTPHWIWLSLFWLSVALVVPLLLWLAWHGAQFLRFIFATIEFASPIRRKKEWPYNASIANRLYHAYSFVQFNNLLDECRVDINLMFFNGSNNEIIVDRAVGAITFNNMPNAGGIQTPRIEETHPTTKIAPLTEFFINLVQYVPKELASQISTCLELGRPLSLNLTNLTILLRRIDNGDTFSAPLRQGITCTKKNNEIAIGHIVYMGASIRG